MATSGPIQGVGAGARWEDKAEREERERWSEWRYSLGIGQGVVGSIVGKVWLGEMAEVLGRGCNVGSGKGMRRRGGKSIIERPDGEVMSNKLENRC